MDGWGCSVEENRRAWSTGNHDNDDRAINIGVINNSQGPNWTTSEAAVSATIDLCVDICIRNGISSLSWVNNGSTQGNMTAHSFFANKACPGPFLMDRMPSIRDTVNTRLTESRNQAAGVTAAANRLRDEGVINTPTFWINNFHAIQFLGGLIIAMANAPKNATPVTITTVDAAIDRLASRGILNSPQYWRDNQGRLEHLGELLIAVARRVP